MVYVSDVVRSDMFGRRVLSLFDSIRLTDCLCTVCIFMYDIFIDMLIIDVLMMLF